jgi:uncharacterized membrane protein
LLLLFAAIPRVDPLRQNIEKFRSQYDFFILGLTAFMFYVFALTIIWNLGLKFSMSTALVPAFALLVFFLGIFLGNVKRNWFVGIRTPWTLADDRVWDKTHKLGSKLFKVGGIVTLFGAFFPIAAFYFIFFPIVVVSLFLVFYSYLEYKKLRI